MNDELTLKVIARIETDLPEKFGIPRQSGLAPALKGIVRFTSEFANPDAVRGLEGYSRIWLLWGFSQAFGRDWSPTVRPPRLGGNARMGVFATRSPFRPNPLGLSCVQLDAVETGNGVLLLRVSGVDLLDGTPIYDVKPYLPYADSWPEAAGGFTDEAGDFLLTVDVSPELLAQIPEERREALLEVLSHDPRPSYQRDPARVYGLRFGAWNVRFTVEDRVLRVCSVEISQKPKS